MDMQRHNIHYVNGDFNGKEPEDKKDVTDHLPLS